MTQRVLVLGGTGMLGAMMVRVLREQGMEAEATARILTDDSKLLGWHWFDANQFNLNTIDIPEHLKRADWIINCIGVTKPVIDADPTKGTKNAIEINALFPHLLARSLHSHQRIIQIATDCVFSGRQEDPATEDTPHDALDVYGKTKSLGEVVAPNFMHLRTSIIGPELRPEKKFLLEWFLGQPQGATVNGFTNHYWNGMTTLQFSKVVAGIIKNPELFRAGVHHLCPAARTTKFHLLAEAGIIFDRPDIAVVPKSSGTKVNRFLETNDPGFNRKLWQGAGYEHPPQVAEMLAELAEYIRVSP